MIIINYQSLMKLVNTRSSCDGRGTLDAAVILSGSRIFEAFKGALTEQYVLQQLKTLPGLEPYYWAVERATAEVDFIFQNQAEIIPLDVKAAENLQAISLESYCLKYKPPFTFRSSLSDYRREDWLINLAYKYTE